MLKHKKQMSFRVLEAHLLVKTPLDDNIFNGKTIY